VPLSLLRGLHPPEERPSRALGVSTLRWISVSFVLGAALCSLVTLSLKRPLLSAPLFVWAGLWLTSSVALWSLRARVNGPGFPLRSALHLPNGLTIVRAQLAPLVACPILIWGAGTAIGPWLSFLLVLLSATDLLDGWIARRRGLQTPLGALLDPFADVAFLTAVSIGLWRTGTMADWIFVVAMIRFPGALVGVGMARWVFGTVRVRGTKVGKILTFSVSLCLLGSAAVGLLGATSATSTAQWLQVGAAVAMLSNFVWIGVVAVRDGQAVQAVKRGGTA
jgi:phosphatidylglycerophosphate synthase